MDMQKRCMCKTMYSLCICSCVMLVVGSMRLGRFRRPRVCNVQPDRPRPCRRSIQQSAGTFCWTVRFILCTLFMMLLCKVKLWKRTEVIYYLLFKATSAAQDPLPHDCAAFALRFSDATISFKSLPLDSFLFLSLGSLVSVVPRTPISPASLAAR